MGSMQDRAKLCRLWASWQEGLEAECPQQLCVHAGAQAQGRLPRGGGMGRGRGETALCLTPASLDQPWASDPPDRKWPGLVPTWHPLATCSYLKVIS